MDTYDDYTILQIMQAPPGLKAWYWESKPPFDPVSEEVELLAVVVLQRRSCRGREPVGLPAQFVTGVAFNGSSFSVVDECHNFWALSMPGFEEEAERYTRQKGEAMHKPPKATPN